MDRQTVYNDGKGMGKEKWDAQTVASWSAIKNKSETKLTATNMEKKKSKHMKSY